MSQDFCLSILTLNIWGLPKFLTPHKKERVIAVGKILKNSNYDVVCLQEVWEVDDFECIKSETEGVLPYSHYFYSGVTGSGLCVFSKWPIVDVMFHQWPLNGYMHMIHHGDWFGGKGVGLAQISCNGLKINVYTSHLHAEYNKISDPYVAHRVVQAFDTATFVRMTSGSSDLYVLAGDFNTQPGELCQKLLQDGALLIDAFNGGSIEYGTNECDRNSFANPSEVKTNPLGQRIDYIFFQGQSGIAKAISYSLPFEEKIPGTNYSYSDHEAVSAVIKFTPTRVLDVEDFSKKNLSIDDILEAINVCQRSQESIKKSAIFYHLFSSIIILLIFLPFHLIPTIYSGIFLITVILLSLGLAFTLGMGTIWHYMESRALTGAILRMKLVLQALNVREKGKL